MTVREGEFIPHSGIKESKGEASTRGSAKKVPTARHANVATEPDARETRASKKSAQTGTCRKEGGRHQRPRKRPRTAIILLIIAVVAAVGGYLWWTRPYELTLNGRDIAARRGASIQRLLQDNDITVKPGNLMSISGNVIEKGGGTQLTAVVDGRALSDKQADAYRVEGGENIEVSNGVDITEDYETSDVVVAPKLRMDGTYGSFAYVSQWGYEGETIVHTGKVSGETVQTVKKQGQDCIITLHNITPDNGQKLVALTFDDGPSEYTQQYLDILTKHQAKATFFMLGSEIVKYPDVAKAVADAGCQVASHTNKHQELPKLDADDLQAELSDTFSDIKNATGVETTFIRPPYGEFRESTWLKSGGLLSASIIWTQDSEDWRRPGADAIVDNALAGIQPGSIILMHDGGGNRDQDLEALPKIIEKLQSEGYQLVTINDLIASDSSIPADIKTADAKLPEGATWPDELGDA